MALFVVFLALLSLVVSVFISLIFAPRVLRFAGELLGRYLRRSSRTRRELLLARVAKEQRSYGASDDVESREQDEREQDDVEKEGSVVEGGATGKDWSGIVGFFHPFCNAGGGGERVLWAAIRVTQKRWPNAVCVVYTGDHDVDKTAMLKRVKDRFNIDLHPPTVHFLYLTKRHYVLSSTWPRFTLLGQSIGSVILAYDAFTLLVPDIFVDTVGYAFSLAFSRLLFPSLPTGAYVHYPTISTDMLNSLDAGGQGMNAGTGEGYRGQLKRHYWTLFAALYSKVGSTIDVVMTNSTWTQGHIKLLWGPYRNARKNTSANDIAVVFPPVAVEDLTSAIDVSASSEANRGPYLLYVAQFRPEKNHTLIVQAFANFLNASPKLPSYPSQRPKLVLIGSVRDSDDATRVYKLRLLAHELGIKEDVEFVCDATWPQMLEWMRKSSVGVNGMWNEHFGIGVVEYQAAGLISVVNDSGGPKLDIVVPVDGKVTGYHASTADEYAEGFRKALSLNREETLAMRKRARQSSARFTDKVFADQWLVNLERLVKLQVARTES